MTGVAIVAAVLVIAIVILAVIVIRVIASPTGLTMATASFSGCAIGFVLGLLIFALASGWCFSEPKSAQQYGGLVAIAGGITAAGCAVGAALLCRSQSR